MSTLSPEHAGNHSESGIETSQLIVRQPAKMEQLNSVLLTIENLTQRVSETGGEDRSGDLGGAGGGAASGQGSSQTSARDQAIAAIPAPVVIQRELAVFIQAEVKKLSRQATNVSRLSQPGSAHKLNELYSKIRRLNALLSSLLEASYEVLKRLFIRVFIDRQTIL